MRTQRSLTQLATMALVFMAIGCVHAVEEEDIVAGECPQICPALYSPVCADNGNVVKEFSNSCELRASNCRLQRSSLATYKQTDMAWCSSSFTDNLIEKLGNLDLMAEGCLKACAMIYRPLCVGNNKYRATLSNECMLENVNCALKKRNVDATELLRVLREREC